MNVLKNKRKDAKGHSYDLCCYRYYRYYRYSAVKRANRNIRKSSQSQSIYFCWLCSFNDHFIFFFLSCVPVLKKSSHFNRCQIFGILLLSFILGTDYISVRFIPHFPFHLKYILHVQRLKHLHTDILETVETETYHMIIFLYYVYAVGCLRQLPLY